MDKRIEILKELLRRTKNREANWTPTNIVDQYSFDLGTGKVIMDYNRPNVGMSLDPFIPHYDYKATFFNKKGTEIDSLSVTDANKISDNYKLLENLWNEIEDAYLGRNETLDSMLDALGLSK